MAEQMTTERIAWLAGLQAGDEVLVAYPDETLGRRERIFAADAEELMIGEHPGAGRRRFRRADGQPADDRPGAELRRIPQALRDQWDARLLAGELWPRLQYGTLDQLRRIEAILEEVHDEPR